MRVPDQIRNFAAVFPSGKRNRMDLVSWLLRRPQLAAAVGGYETALVLSGRLDTRLKYLAELKAAAMITCEYCMDIGSAFARRSGITDAQLRDLPRYAESAEFSPDEKLVLEFAEAMTRIPTTVEDDLRERLLSRFTRAQIAELAATIAWENHRGRLNQALGVRPGGFSDDAVCVVPERATAST